MNHRVDYTLETAKLEAFGARNGVDMSLGYDGWSTDVDLQQCSIEGAWAAVENSLGMERVQRWKSLHAQGCMSEGDASSADLACCGASAESGMGALDVSVSTVAPFADVHLSWTGGGAGAAGVSMGEGPSSSLTAGMESMTPFAYPALFTEAAIGSEAAGVGSLASNVAAIRSVLEGGAVSYLDALIPEYDEGATVSPPLPAQSI
jgi:hypothetical protein